MNVFDKPLVSVILATYNRRQTLPRAVHSVLAQTYTDIELIVVDDGSSDGTAEWMTSLADARVRYVQRTRNGGAAAARNDGIRIARGSLIAFQDSDDEWLATKLENQVALMQSSPSEVGLIVGNYIIAEPDGAKHIGSTHLLRGYGYEEDLLHGYALVAPTWLVQKTLLEELNLFDEKMPPVEDWDLSFRLSDRCRIQAVIGPIMIKYGSHDSIFGDHWKRLDALRIVLNRHGHRWGRHKHLLAGWHAHVGALLGLREGASTGRQYLLNSIRAEPIQLAAYMLLVASFGGNNFFRLACRALRRVPAWTPPLPV